MWGVELDPKDRTSFSGERRRFWRFDTPHIWEGYGDNHEGTELTSLAVPWMTKRQGSNYLQYPAPWTGWKTYAPRNRTVFQTVGHHTVV